MYRIYSRLPGWRHWEFENDCETYEKAKSIALADKVEMKKEYGEDWEYRITFTLETDIEVF